MSLYAARDAAELSSKRASPPLSRNNSGIPVPAPHAAAPCPVPAKKAHKKSSGVHRKLCKATASAAVLQDEHDIAEAVFGDLAAAPCRDEARLAAAAATLAAFRAALDQAIAQRDAAQAKVALRLAMFTPAASLADGAAPDSAAAFPLSHPIDPTTQDEPDSQGPDLAGRIGQVLRLAAPVAAVAIMAFGLLRRR